MTACDFRRLVLLGLHDRTSERADYSAAGRSIRGLADAVGLEDTLTDTLAAVRDASKIATLRCLSELGALALETGDPDTARERLSVGRELAAETGETLSRDRFDALLESSETPFDESFGTSSDEASETLLKTDRSAAGDDSDGHSRGPETDGGG